MRRFDFDRLRHKRFAAIGGEHRDHNVDADLEFSGICGCHIDEDVASIESNL